LTYIIVIRKKNICYDGKEKITNFAAQYREELIDGEIQFNAYIAEIGELKGKFGHFQYNAHKMLYQDENDGIPKLNQKADFCIGKSIKFVNGVKK